MKLKAVYEIQGLSNVLTGTRKSEGIANPGDLYEVDTNTAKKHLAEGYGVDPSEAVAENRFERGPSIIEGEVVTDDAPATLADIAPKIGGSAPAEPAAKPAKGKGKGGKKAAAKADDASAEPADQTNTEENASEEDGIDDLGLDDGSDSVE